jgi:exopolysaccharide biosynthesis operon protein EpsL
LDSSNWKLAVLVMFGHAYKPILVGCLLCISASALAEGMIDIKPYVSANVSYDDNVFRFSSSDQAKAAFGSSATSDVVKRIDLGVNVNLRLSRQVFTLASNINESRYDRFDILDNTGKSNRLGWNWRLGNDVYGELSASKSDAIAGFNEIKQPVKNLRTTSRQKASVHWNFHPSWTADAIREHVKTENELISFNGSDREDDVFETGVRYQNPLGTQLGLAYRILDSDFPNRTFSILGDESTKKDIIVTAAWLPTAKTKISARISQVSIEYKDTPQRDFNGLSQRWNLDHALTGKTNINLTAYQEVSPVDDVLSTYVKTKGFGVNPVWNATSKIAVRAGLGYEERDYLGSSGFLLVDSDRYDESKLANLSLIYAPTTKSVVQIQYQGEKRTSNAINFDYQFNNINFLLRYDF